MSEVLVKNKNFNNIDITKSIVYVPNNHSSNIQSSYETKETLNEEISTTLASNSNIQQGHAQQKVSNNINIDKKNKSLRKTIINSDIYYGNNKINDMNNKQNLDISDSRIYELKRLNSKKSLINSSLFKSDRKYSFEKTNSNYTNDENKINMNVAIYNHEISNEFQANNYQNVLPYQMPYGGVTNPNVNGDCYANKMDINEINANQYKINNQTNDRTKSAGKHFNISCNCGDICCISFCVSICTGCAKSLCNIF